jgi:conjugative relaxase-like TrwC/TraI family protein
VLTIGKLGRTRGRLEYYDAQVAAGVEDYYAGRGESPGRWRGAGIRALGLSPGDRVDRAGFMAVMQGRRPVDGSVLRPVGARSTVAGFDLTFSAPKSVSVLFAVADGDVASAALDAHELAVVAALEYLEREACWTRRGHDGVERVRGAGFVAASYRHRMSRSSDPQLHTHVVVANMTLADGRFTALDAHAIYEHKSAGGTVYRAVLREELRRRLPWVKWRTAGRGLFEIDGIPEPVLRHFSQRRVEIEEQALALVGADGELSRERMQGIALATRRAKQYVFDGGSWREQARARASEHGFGARELLAVTKRRPQPRQDPDASAVSGRLSGPSGLTERHNTFARRHALAELGGTFEQGVAIEQLERVTDAYLTSAGVVEVCGKDERRYTTADLLAHEAELIGSAVRRRTERCGVVSASLVDEVIVRSTPALNDGQTAAVRTITSRGRGVDAVEALAGTGKTTMIGALAACYQQAGWSVIGAAPTGRAARELRDTAGIEATTIHSLLLELNRSGGFDQRTLLVLDEAAMTPTRHASLLLAHAERAGSKVIAVGDSGQLGPVQAGGWLAAINQTIKGPSLRQVLRQHERAEQLALEALHDGDPDTYLDHKRPETTVHATELDAILELVGQWETAQRQHGIEQVAMIARDNLTRERLNRAARARLKQEGLLEVDGVFVGGREYAPGDRVIARRNSRRHDVDNGTLATITRIDAATGQLWIATDQGERRTLNHNYAAAHLQHAYALTGHGAQGSTFAWIGAVGRPEEFTKEWAYTALSRAREQTTIHVVSDRSEREQERDEYAPAQPDRTLDESVDAMRRSIRRSETEHLAAEQLPQAGAAAPQVGDWAGPYGRDATALLGHPLSNRPPAIRR